MSLPDFEGDKFGSFPPDWEVIELTTTPSRIEILAQPETGQRPHNVNISSKRFGYINTSSKF